MIVILMGAPGAGKGTQSERLETQLGFVKISTGDILRNHIARRTKIGLAAKDLMDEGKLVPDEILLEVLAEELGRVGDRVALLDGFPRTLKQAEALERIAAKKPIKAVIQIKVDEAVIIERLASRLLCGQCGAVYTSKIQGKVGQHQAGGKCPECSGSLGTRPDDAPEKVRFRLKVYADQTRPVLDFYAKKHLCHMVDGSQSVENVFKQIKEIIT